MSCSHFFVELFPRSLFQLMIAEPEDGVDGYRNQVEDVEGECQGQREYAVNGVVQDIVGDAADIAEENDEREDHALAAGALALQRFEDGDRPCNTEAQQHQNFENRGFHAKDHKRIHNWCSFLNIKLSSIIVPCFGEIAKYFCEKCQNTQEVLSLGADLSYLIFSSGYDIIDAIQQNTFRHSIVTGGRFYMAKRILIVDDEPAMVKGLSFNLEKQEGYVVNAAYDGEEALKLFRENTYDLILLDLMLPKIDGMEVCQKIREVSNVPIIMLSAKGEDMDKIMGLEYGADDYMTKPFNMLELKARIKTIFRRTDALKEKPSSQVISVQGMTVDMTCRSVVVGDKEVNLTAKEFDLLQLFITNRGKVFNRESLLEIVWKHQGDLRVVDVHIRRLREKVEVDPAHPIYILTKWGVGYYFSNI